MVRMEYRLSVKQSFLRGQCFVINIVIKPQQQAYSMYYLHVYMWWTGCNNEN